MLRYMHIKEPEDLVGLYYEMRDSGFYAKRAKITRAYYLDDGELVVICFPDTLKMGYGIPRQSDGTYNLERVHNEDEA